MTPAEALARRMHHAYLRHGHDHRPGGITSRTYDQLPAWHRTLYEAVAADLIAPAATEDRHLYLSTGCLHGEHAYCQAMTGQQGEKRPGRCKFCEAPCVCACHVGATS